MRELADFQQAQLIVVRDSITHYQEILRGMHTLNVHKDTQITLLRSNQEHYKNIIKIQDKVIEESRFDRMVAYITTGVSMLITLAAIL